MSAPITHPRHLASRLLLAGASLALAGAATAAYTPALPEAGKIPLSGTIQQPKNVRWANGTAEVNCQVLVSRKGKAVGSKCGLAEGIKGSTSESVLGATYAGLRRAKFKPATLDGSAVDVVMSVRVRVRCLGQNCEASTYPNLGLYTAEHGNDYVAPQEVLTSSKTWYERWLDADGCAVGKSPKDACVDDGAFRMVVYVDVDAQGKPTNARHRRNPLTAESDTLMELAHESVEQSRFMPGQVGGKPVPMTVLSSSLHYSNNKRIPKTICVENTELGSRLASKRCYNAQEHARVKPGLQIYSWLPMTTGGGGLTSTGS
ncbi:MAG: hypothetical protein AAFX85_16225 [Pseudomonadota bacterium]